MRARRRGWVVPTTLLRCPSGVSGGPIPPLSLPGCQRCCWMEYIQWARIALCMTKRWSASGTGPLCPKPTAPRDQHNLPPPPFERGSPILDVPPPPPPRKGVLRGSQGGGTRVFVTDTCRIPYPGTEAFHFLRYSNKLFAYCPTDLVALSHMHLPRPCMVPFIVPPMSLTCILHCDVPSVVFCTRVHPFLGV